MKKVLTFILILILLLAVAAASVFGYKYYQAEQTKQAKQAALLLAIKNDDISLPAKIADYNSVAPGKGDQLVQSDLANHNAVARVAGEYVPLADAQFEYKSIAIYYSNQTPPDGKKVDLTEPKGIDLAKQIVGQLATDKIILATASQKGVSVTDLEVESQVKQIIASAGGEDKVSTILKQYYGWTLDDLRKKIRQQLLATKLDVALGGVGDTSTNVLSSTYTTFPKIDPIVKAATKQHTQYLLGDDYKVIYTKIQ